MAIHFSLSLLSAVIGVGSLILWKRIKSSAENKNSHNLPIFLLEREIFNLSFDLKKIEGQKIYLPNNLAEFVTTNPVHVDERGFERAARLDNRKKP